MRAQTMPLIVYLDSQDYSNLSGQSALLAELVELRESDQATYVYSSAIVSECAPLTPSATKFAVERSENISKLCGRNTFISIDRILEREFFSLDSSPPTRDQVLSINGDWFPSVDSLLSPLDRRQGFEKVLAEKSLNRNQRRTVRSKAMRGGSFRTSAAQSMLAESQETLVEMIRTYPMKHENASLLLKYIAGIATKAQAEHALLESLRDPHWMMRWFHQHSDNLSFVPSFIRAPSKNVHDRMRQSIALSKSIDSPEKRWHQLIDELIVELSGKYAQEHGVQADVTLDRIYQHCPGFVTVFQTLREFVKDSMGDSSRRLKESDFADAIHSMHAPYVDIFRTDKYMAGKISLCNGATTTICSRLSDLPSLIRQSAARI